MLLFFCAQPSYVLKWSRETENPWERVVCLFVCCEWSWYMLLGMMTRLLGQFFSFSSFSLFFCTASHMHTALICYFAVNKRFSSDVCVALDLCVSSYTYVAYIVESANFWDNIEQKKWLFQHVTYVVKRPKYIRYVHNIGLFVRLHSVCFNFFFILNAFSYSGRFFSFATAETSLSLQVISCILDLGMVVWGPSLRQTHIKGWNASLFLFVCNF